MWKPALAIEHSADHHLVQIGPMVFAVAVLAQGVATLALEIQRGGVEEDDLQFAEQIATAREQLFFDDVLGAARHELAEALLLRGRQLLAEPGHSAVQLVQFDFVGAVEQVIHLPGLSGTIAAGGAESMQDSEEDSAFDGEFERACSEQLVEDVLAAGLVPKPLEDKGGPNALGGDSRHLTVLVGGQQKHMLGEASAGGEQPIEVAGLLEPIESPERSEDTLAYPTLVAGVFDDLEVLAWSGVFDTEEHGGASE